MNAVQCRMARAGLDFGVRELAELSGVSASAIGRIERGGAVGRDKVAAVKAALEREGIVFLPEDSRGVGVRLKFTRREVRALDTMENEGGIVADDDVA